MVPILFELYLPSSNSSETNRFLHSFFARYLQCNIHKMSACRKPTKVKIKCTYMYVRKILRILMKYCKAKNGTALFKQAFLVT